MPKWTQDTWVRPFFTLYRKSLLTSAALGIGAAVFSVALMAVSGFLISASAERPEFGVFALMMPLGLVQVFGIGKPFLAYFERLESHSWVLRMASDLRLQLYESVRKSSMLKNASRKAGDMLGLLAGDIGHIQDLYLKTIFPIGIAWTLWIIAVVAFGVVSLPMAGIMLVSLAVFTVLVPLVSVLVNGAKQLKAKQAHDRFYGTAYDAIAGVGDWICSGRRDEFEATLRTYRTSMSAEESALSLANRRRDFWVNIAFGVLSCVVAIWAAVHFGSIAQAGPATGLSSRPLDFVAAFTIGFFPLLEAFAPLGEAATSSVLHRESIARLNEVDADDETANADSGETKIDDADASSTAPSPAATPAFQDASVTLDTVQFSYPGEQERTVRGVSLHVAPGQNVALLGPSGSGKSTLLGLIRGDLTPASGTITVGGANPIAFGNDIANHVGMIRQEPYLFNQTLLENLRIGNAEATEEEATAALEAVGLGKLLADLPDGLKTIVDAGGLRFSGGERHRIALARVLLQNVDIVLLDEPTTGLDPDTERGVLDTLFRVLSDKTVIMVTHHLFGIEHVDQVVFFENGSVALEGRPAELEQTSERFRQLLAFDR